MKSSRRCLSLAVISALLLSGCSTPGSENSSPAPLSSDVNQETEQDTAETTQATFQTTSEPKDQVSVYYDNSPEIEFPCGGSVGKLYQMDYESYPQMIQLSENNIFVDYDYIKDIPSDSGHEKYNYFTDIAVEAVKGSDRYKIVSKWINDNPTASEITIDYLSDGTIKKLGEWITDGELDIETTGAYISDYDGDGNEEAFVVIKTMLEAERIFDYVIFVNSSGHADPEYKWNSLRYLVSVDMLDYGRDKQLVFYAYGDYGASTHSPLIGVRNGKMFTHYDFRGQYIKSDCFLMTSGWQASGEYMVYDTSARRYYTVIGKEISIDDLYAMDSTGVLTPKENLVIPEAQIIGNKYYALGGAHFLGGVDFYVYENGAFVKVQCDNILSDNMFIRISEHPTKNTVYIEDFDQALATMVTPEQAAELLGNE